tara:strand:- start:213 stop:572 length:360 start_codon:yes stop_codon:yes gene_type:complete
MIDISNSDSDVWVMFDGSGNRISDTYDKKINLLGELEASIFDVSSCYVIKNPECYFKDCYCYVEDGKVICKKSTRETYAKEQEIFKNRFPPETEPIDEIGELKKQLAEFKELINSKTNL